MDPSDNLLDDEDFDGAVSSLIHARRQGQGQNRNQNPPKAQHNSRAECHKTDVSKDGTIPLGPTIPPSRLPPSLLVKYQEPIVVEESSSRSKSEASNIAQQALAHENRNGSKEVGVSNNGNDDAADMDQSETEGAQHMQHGDNRCALSFMEKRSGVSGVKSSLSKMSLHRKRGNGILGQYQEHIGIETRNAAPTAAAVAAAAAATQNETMETSQRLVSIPLCVASGNFRRPKRRRRGSVRFDYTGQSIESTISRTDMTDDEIRSTWLQQDEFTKICQRDENLIARAEQEPSPSCCIRGLESKMTLNALRTQSKRLKCLEKVFIEQDRQWEYQEKDPNAANIDGCYDEAIAAASMKVTKDCKILAQEVASSDRREVERFLEEEKDNKNACDNVTR